MHFGPDFPTLVYHRVNASKFKTHYASGYCHCRDEFYSKHGDGELKSIPVIKAYFLSPTHPPMGGARRLPHEFAARTAASRTEIV